jgi:hypothetical protein
VTVSLFNALAQIASSGAQSQSQYQLQLIGNRLTAQLNQKIADLKAQANNPTLPILQQQAASLNAKKTTYDNAEAQLVANGSPTNDLATQLVTMTTAAAAGDSNTFDAALTAANTDVADLNAVTLLPGFQPDGAANLKGNGLGIQSSATYNLSTAAGQAQAAADISAAQTVVSQLSTMTTQNTSIAVSVSQALEAQITSLNNQVAAIQAQVMTNSASQIQTLQQQTQTQFHLIELSMGGTNNTSTMLQNFENAQAASNSGGGILSVLDTQLSSSSTSAASSKTSSSSNSASSSSQPGSSFSITA